MRIPTQAAPSVAPRWGYHTQDRPQGLSKLSESPENKQAGAEGLLSLDRQAATNPSDPGSAASSSQGHSDQYRRVSSQAATRQGSPGKRANDPSGASHKLRRDLQLFRRLPLVQEKALTLMEENPDTPLKVLSKKSMGSISEEGLSHLAQRDIANWFIYRKKPVQQDPSARVGDWMERPRQAGASRFQREFLKQQQAAQKQAEAMDALQLAFRKLKLSD